MEAEGILALLVTFFDGLSRIGLHKGIDLVEFVHEIAMISVEKESRCLKENCNVGLLIISN